jgi:hypothetical protein
MSAVKQFEFAANIMNVKMRKLLLIGFFAITLVLPLAADIKADWQVEWDQTVRTRKRKESYPFTTTRGTVNLGRWFRALGEHRTIYTTLTDFTAPDSSQIP